MGLNVPHTQSPPPPECAAYFSSSTIRGATPISHPISSTCEIHHLQTCISHLLQSSNSFQDEDESSGLMHADGIPKDTPLHSCNDRHTYWQPLSACPVEEKTPHCFNRGDVNQRGSSGMLEGSVLYRCHCYTARTILDSRFSMR